MGRAATSPDVCLALSRFDSSLHFIGSLAWMVVVEVFRGSKVQAPTESWLSHGTPLSVLDLAMPFPISCGSHVPLQGPTSFKLAPQHQIANSQTHREFPVSTMQSPKCSMV